MLWVHREHTVGVTLQGSSQSTRNWLGLHQLLLTLNKKSPHGQCVCVWEGGENRCNNSVTASPHGQCVCVTRRWELMQQLSYSTAFHSKCITLLLKISCINSQYKWQQPTQATHMSAAGLASHHCLLHNTAASTLQGRAPPTAVTNEHGLSNLTFTGSCIVILLLY